MMSEKKELKVPFLQAKDYLEGDPDQYFDYFFGMHRPPMMPAEKGWHPMADLYETETHIVLVVDIAGISVNDIKLTLHKQILLLQGVRRELTGEPTRQYHKMEVAYGPFERAFRLPTPVQPDNVHADYKDGLLTIRLVKRSKPLTRRTTIKIR